MTGTSAAAWSDSPTRAARRVLDSAPRSTTPAPWACMTRARRIADSVRDRDAVAVRGVPRQVDHAHDQRLGVEVAQDSADPDGSHRMCQGLAGARRPGGQGRSGRPLSDSTHVSGEQESVILEQLVQSHPGQHCRARAWQGGPRPPRPAPTSGRPHRAPPPAPSPPAASRLPRTSPGSVPARRAHRERPSARRAPRRRRGRRTSARPQPCRPGRCCSTVSTIGRLSDAVKATSSQSKRHVADTIASVGAGA